MTDYSMSDRQSGDGDCNRPKWRCLDPLKDIAESFAAGYVLWKIHASKTALLGFKPPRSVIQLARGRAES